ncbi:MAG: hypothetical protein P0Y49_07275 [Candidatus Pedobacter colombiensis]|uniref:LTXXQ motif family protein n=1 Tax=Candidatus Pedobacter colombiensis TaxID=3121371 RepID=A0AAJ5WE21_9SPHI|nr:hypothetical protein [Pedobacter sp.]WEK20937.1 MAG: hypothetical protein P0Y49_07275 [Pedobacter sp.]
MKKVVLLFGMMLITTVIFAQNKPKNIKELRDSVFTVMKLSDENRQKMHDVIAESGKAQKAIKDDATLNDEQKKEKIKVLRTEMAAKEKMILTPEQSQMWKEFAAAQKNKPKQ